MAVGKPDTWRWVGRVLCLLIALTWPAFTPTASADLGERVSNIASITYEADGNSLTFPTNEAAFVIEARRTPSTIAFYRYAPGASDAISVQINGSDYVAPGQTGDPAAYQPVGQAVSGGVVIDTGMPVSLVPTSQYLANELLFVRVEDAGQNGNPDKIESIIVTIISDSGDEIILRLYEEGPNSGVFWGYAPTSPGPTAPYDVLLTSPPDGRLEAIYTDPFDAAEVSAAVAATGHVGRVFDSLTGQPVNGALVTLVDAATGQPASLTGLDGVSVYPSTLETGSDVQDGSGRVYPLADGEFMFPVVPPGSYRLEVVPPAGYTFPSTRSDLELASLPGAPFTIVPASRGKDFVQLSTEPFLLDIPVDPAGELIVSKTALSATASIGDAVGFQVDVTNRDSFPATVDLTDIMPRGLRYVAGSARRNGAPVDESSVSTDGSLLRIRAGFLRPGESARITYVAIVSPDARLGEAVNRVQAWDANGRPASNEASASVEITEDLLSSRLTIIGRVHESDCTGDDGAGIEGVRLYMETGDYVATDEEGLYHFEAVKPGSHVVQLDQVTVPKGYEPVLCRDSTRRSGSAISEFVDVQGGTVWRVDFTLKRTGELPEEAAVTASEGAEADRFDAEWLETADPAPRWLYPDTTHSPSSQSVNIGIVHPKRYSVELMLNGEPVPAVNFAGREAAKDGPAEISRWRGIDIREGASTFRARILDPKGAEVSVLEETVWYVADVERVRLVADQSVLVADGQDAPVIAVRLENAAGRPVHKGRVVKVDVDAPYTLRTIEQFERESAVSALNVNTGLRAGEDGVALVELEPTMQTGRVRLRVYLDDGRIEEIEAWLAPEKREWIVVGLAEGMTGLESLDGTAGSGSDLVTDGRVALFAKGMVKGDWLMTLALDTAKRRGESDTGLFDGHIDPNAYYTLYGDRTWQYSDAESRYPLYVKLERDTTQLLFGDFQTDLTDTHLGRYARKLSGLKGVYEGRNIGVTAFASETSQDFVKDEIAADGTSGPYRLSVAPVVRNSEQVSVETRDRVRPDIILSRQTYVRHIDYDLDVLSGEIIFRHPVAATDLSFNPNVIVVDYEAAADAAREMVAGGRVALRTDNRKYEIGVTHLREDGNSAELSAADLTIRLDENTEVRAEKAVSARKGAARDADAYLIEVEREGEALTVTGYMQEQDAGFGLGQQGSATDATRRIGVEGRYAFGDAAERSAADAHGIEASAYREESLTSGARRDVAEAAFTRGDDLQGWSLGMKSVHEDYQSAGERRSVLATGSFRRNFADHGLTVAIAHEQPLGARGDDATLFPERTQLSADKVLTEKVTLNLRHEMSNGANASGNTTLLGLTMKPWAGAEARVSADSMTQDAGQRLGATVGLDQTVRITEQWSVSLGAARRARIDGGDEARDATPDDSLSPFKDGVRTTAAATEAFTSAYAGAGYRSESTAGSVRAEMRDGDNGKRWTLSAGGAREASETLSFGLAARAMDETGMETPDRRTAEMRLGAAYRPRGAGMTVYDRLDVKQERVDTVQDVAKVVNNLGVNWQGTDKTQVSVNWGVKYQEGDVAGVRVSGVTQLIGTEVRHDISEKWDVGVAATALVEHQTGTVKYAVGPNVGFSPAENMWLSAGYNLSGFEDRDFEAAEYARRGAYIKLRVKFDQQTASGLLERISPKRD
ncbi:MAG: hypothetical protein R3C13_06645 [Hyphomonas sp.]|uniref:hypothetical protein n=1 Tax=Hyphomonas sp. TaxID=87 RepID=UPI00352911F2